MILLWGLILNHGAPANVDASFEMRIKKVKVSLMNTLSYRRRVADFSSQ